MVVYSNEDVREISFEDAVENEQIGKALVRRLAEERTEDINKFCNDCKEFYLNGELIEPNKIRFAFETDEFLGAGKNHIVFSVSYDTLDERQEHYLFRLRKTDVITVRRRNDNVINITL